MSEVRLRDLEIGDAGWLIEQHGILYARDEGFDSSFEAEVAEILANYILTRNPARERGWIAEQSGKRLGSIFCVDAGDDVAKLRLLLLVPEARGLGIGDWMVRTCLAYAKSKGYRAMRLWTHDSHRAACALYEKHGFRLTAAKPVHSYSQDLIEQTWEIAF